MKMFFIPEMVTKFKLLVAPKTDALAKGASGSEKSGHLYIRRTGTPGNYDYEYPENKGGKNTRSKKDVEVFGGENMVVSGMVNAGSPEAHDAFGPHEDLKCTRCGAHLGRACVTEHGPMGADCVATVTGDKTWNTIYRKLHDSFSKYEMYAVPGSKIKGIELKHLEDKYSVVMRIQIPGGDDKSWYLAHFPDTKKGQAIAVSSSFAKEHNLEYTGPELPKMVLPLESSTLKYSGIPEPKFVIHPEIKGQLDLFKAITADNDFVPSADDFTLCMSLAGQWISEGRFEEAIDLIKAATHKYLRRYPSGKVTPKWYYVYKITSQHLTPEVQVGEKVQVSSDDQKGHYEIEAVHPNGWVTIKHDETGQRLSVKQEWLHEQFAQEHKDVIEAAHKKLAEAASAAQEYGTEVQKEKTQKALQEHRDRFANRVPAAIAKDKARGMTMFTQAAPSVENHLAAAQAHEYAAGFGTEHKALHLEMAAYHRDAANSAAMQAKTKEALIGDGVTYFIPGKTEAEKAANNPLVKPGQRKSHGAYFTTKREAYTKMVPDEFRADFGESDKAYHDWKASKGAKPKAYQGGLLDPINEALGLRPITKGFNTIDHRVTSLAEGFDRLMGMAKRYDSEKAINTYNVLRQIQGLENLQMPTEMEEAINAKIVAQNAAQEAKERVTATEYSQADIDAELADLEARGEQLHDVFQEADSDFDVASWEREFEEADKAELGQGISPEDEDPVESYKHLGVKAKSFKAWFGDWESNPAEASKVIKKDGSPAEQSNMAPMVVYHGTAVGGYSEFDPKKVSSYNIFGEGFYFTEDQEVAKEYTKKDKGADTDWEYCHGFRDAKGNSVEYIPNDIAERIINKIPGYSPSSLGKKYEYTGDRYIAAALRRAMTNKGVSVTKFLQEYRNPSGPVLDNYGHPESGASSFTGNVETLQGLVASISQRFGGMLIPVVNPPEVFETFLNVRKPIDMEAEITREEFEDFAGYIGSRTDNVVSDLKRGIRIEPKIPENWEPTSGLAFYTKNLNDNNELAEMGHDRYEKSFTYPEMIHAKKILRKETTGESNNKPAYGIFHLTDENKLTWGDVHYILTDGHNNSIPKGFFKEWAERKGYDGITHTGGWNIGKKAHKVWIAWKPNQIKAKDNYGMFDPGSNDIKKSLTYRTNIFVIREDKLFKAGGPYIGPRGGLWADPEHTQHWEPNLIATVPTIGAIDSENMKVKEDQLSALPREELEKIVYQLDAVIQGGGNEALRLWQNAAHEALARKPKMVAKVASENKKQMGFDFDVEPEIKPMSSKPVTKPLPADKPVDVVQEMAEGNIPEKLIPVGDHIWGSRKDIARMHIESIDDLKAMTFDDAVAAVTKKKLIPAFDLDTLKGMGQEPAAAYFTLALLASITDRPRKNRRYIDHYVTDIKNILASLQNCKTVKDIFGLGEEMIHSYNRGDKWEKVSDKTYDSTGPAYDEKVQLEKDNPGEKYTVLRHSSHTTYKTDYYVAIPAVKPYGTLGNKIFDMFSANRKSVDFLTEVKNIRAMPMEAGWEYLKTRGMDSKTAEKVKAADKKANKNKPAFTQAQFEQLRKTPLEREGGGEPIRKADANRTLATFDLKEIDYGTPGYMTQDDRESHTAWLEVSLHDLSDLLQIPKKQVSFKGRLGIALGARGSTECPIAHYEREKFVINITKYQGGGSLAHEWAHALDNVLAVVYRPENNQTTNLSAVPEASFLPDHIKKAYQKVHEAMSISPNYSETSEKHLVFHRELQAKDNQMSEKYNGLIRESRILQGKVKPEMVEVVKNRYKAQEAELLPKYNAAETKLKELEIKKHGEHRARGWENAYKQVSQYGSWLKSIQKQIKELEEGTNIRQPGDEEKADKLKSDAEAMLPEINRIRKEIDINSAFDGSVSNFKRSAMLLGAGYWGAPTEMFARAFESYISDKMGEIKRRNSYLVNRWFTNLKFPTGKAMPDGSQAQPFPQGEERKRINATIDEFLDVLRKHDELTKALYALP